VWFVVCVGVCGCVSVCCVCEFECVCVCVVRVSEFVCIMCGCGVCVRGCVVCV